MTPTNILTKTEIISDLQLAYQQVETMIQAVPEEQLYISTHEKWSIGENMQHLLLSSIPVASALKMPKDMIKNFGSPNGPSRTYEVLLDTYKNVLAKGLKAPSRFLPNPTMPKTKEELLNAWKEIGEKLSQRIAGFWTEEDLENYAMPHPAFGLLTVREILLSTIFHTYHHLEAMRKLV